MKAIFATATFVTRLAHHQVMIGIVGTRDVIGSVGKGFFDSMIDESADDDIDVVDVM